MIFPRLSTALFSISLLWTAACIGAEPLEEAAAGIGVASRSSSAMGDFTGDGYADYADLSTSTGQFWIRRNYRDGTFMPFITNWGYGRAAAGAGWRTLVADFTGDGHADFADLHEASGQLWIHENTRDGGFASANWGTSTVRVGPNVEILAGDVNGDRKADLVERDAGTGVIRVKLNLRNGSACPSSICGGGAGGDSFAYPNTGSLFRTVAGPDWRVLLADFTGDGLADLADVHVPSGNFWVHRNRSDATAEWDSADWGHGVGSGGAGWKILAGDFTGDGRADYADLYVSTGQLWVHAADGAGGFAPFGANWGYAQSNRPDASWQLLGE